MRVSPMKAFWISVRELAAMRELIPTERRAMSRVRLFFAPSQSLPTVTTSPIPLGTKSSL